MALIDVASTASHLLLPIHPCITTARLSSADPNFDEKFKPTCIACMLVCPLHFSAIHETPILKFEPNSIVLGSSEDTWWRR
jgi:hypothetical protein